MTKLHEEWEQFIEQGGELGFGEWLECVACVTPERANIEERAYLNYETMRTDYLNK